MKTTMFWAFVATTFAATFAGCGDMMTEVYNNTYVIDTENETETDTTDVNIETNETEVEAEINTEVETDVEVETETDVDEREPVPEPALEAEPEPADEICDCEDNDSDGETDEGCEDLFLSFPVPVTCDCSGGMFPCMNIDEDGDTNVFWARQAEEQAEECPDGYVPRCHSEPETEPTAEICDGLDNDGDGEVDEVHGACVYLSPSNGEYLAGQFMCGYNSAEHGRYASCVPCCDEVDDPSCAPCVEFAVADEFCDNEDNNGNGLADEELYQQGACVVNDFPATGTDVPGTWYCAHTADGAFWSCSWQCSMHEVCDDGLDNDCDGEVDEGCPTVPELTELCDRVDNDGDGEVDEFDEWSDNVITDYCVIRLIIGSDDESVLAEGRLQCVLTEVEEDGHSVVRHVVTCALYCQEEICGDGVDNDCDGEVDEECEPEPVPEEEPVCDGGEAWDRGCPCFRADQCPVGTVCSNPNFTVEDDELIPSGQCRVPCGLGGECPEGTACFWTWDSPLCPADAHYSCPLDVFACLPT